MEFMLLEDCCEILDSLRIPITASDREKGIYPYYGANGIQDYVSSYIFDDDLVLLAEDGGSFGSKTKPIAYRVSGKCWVNNHAHVLKPKEGIDVDFLCYSLMFYNTKGLVNGATRQKLTQSAMRKMKIPKLHIDIQLDIVKEIKSVISIIDIREKQLEKLSLLVRARFVEMFGDLKNTIRLGDCCKVHARIGWQALTRDEHMKTGEYMLVTGTDFIDGKINYNTCVYVTRERYEMDPHIILRENDILITKDGSIGKVAIIHNLSKPATLNSGVFVVRPKDIFNKEYISGVFRGPLFEKFIELSKTGATIKHLNQKHLVEFRIPLPTLEKQEVFARFSNQINKSKFPTLHNHKSIYTKLQLCCKMVIVNVFLNTKRF